MKDSLNWIDGISVGDGGDWVHLDAAGAIALDNGQLDVALVAPAGVPAVLHEPIVLARSCVGAVADGEDGVVQVGAAVLIVHHARVVELEARHVGLDGDGGGLVGHGGLHLVDLGGGHAGVVADGDGGRAGLVVEALAVVAVVTGGVGVDGLELGLGAVLVVLVGLILESTVAALVDRGLVAADELLLGEGQKLAGGHEVGTLERACRREGPAGAASALVLDTGHSAGVNPVDLGGQTVRGKGRVLAVAAVSLEESSATLVTENARVLLGAPVAELVVAELVAGLSGVVLFDNMAVAHEVLQTDTELINVVIDLIPLGEVVNERQLLNVDSRDSAGSNSSESKRFHS